MLRYLALPLSVSLASLLGACTAPDQASDELVGEADGQDDGKADVSSGTSTYFAITRDMRRCVSPKCGGYLLDRVNATKTTCHDGGKAESCYTPELDWSQSGLTQAQRDAFSPGLEPRGSSGGVYALVRGRFKPTNTTTSIPSLGRFVVTEAWVAVGEGLAEGVFARIEDSGIRCITTPCPSTRERGLNSSRQANIDAVDFEAGELSDTAVESLWNDVATTGYIVAGDRYTFTEQGRSGKGRRATNAYRNVANITASTGEACFVGGCSAHICSDQEGIISTCEWHESYACYATATCERQAGGECGWTETPELNSCIEGSL